MMIRFSDRTAMVIKNAYEVSVKTGLNYTATEHLLYGILSEGENKAFELLEKAGLNEDIMVNALAQVSGKSVNEEITADPDVDINKVVESFTPRTKRVLEISALAAKNSAQNVIEPEHLLMAIIREGDNVALKIMAAAGIDVRAIYGELMAFTTPSGGEHGSFSQEEQIDEDADDPEIDDINSNLKKYAAKSKKSGGKSRSKTPTLDKYGRDLTSASLAGEFDPIIGREKEIERVMQILCRRTKNNPCLIGEPGVGKTAIAEGLAQKIAQGTAPEILKGKRLVSLDLAGMIAGAKYRGEFEERFKKSLGEAVESGDTVLFLDELHTVIGAGNAEGGMDAANILKPMLARGKLQIIGATTIDEYRKRIEKDPAFERRFQPVTVGEPTPDEAALILKGIKDKYEAHHNVKIPDQVVEEAVKLSVRYITDRFLPDKGIDLIDEAASRKRMRSFTEPEDFRDLEQKLSEISAQKKAAAEREDFESAAKLRTEEISLTEELDNEREKWKQHQETKENILTPEDIADIVSDWSGIPVNKLTETDSEKLKNLEEELHKRIIGQDEAVKAVAKAIRRGRLGLKDPKRPTGSFIFLGTTGVGKTELAKALAEVMFGSENMLVRLDMSEYMEKFDVSKLIGSPPGYVGYDEGGQLTEKVRRKPYSVVLFDEIEKAHPDVFNALLQILEDGRLTDGQGRTIDFRNTVIIMTSNVGARMLTGSQGRKIGFEIPSLNDDKKKSGKEVDEGMYGGRSYSEAKGMVTDELKKTFNPEFINRIDEIVFFHMLNKESMMKIVRIMLNNLKIRIKETGIALEFTDEAMELLARKGYDPSYGARPLRRVIQSNIEDKLSEAMLDGIVADGDSAKVIAEDDEVVIRKA
ncbi:MAG: ATP-dependent Clp protease ATP-binding subunit [Eubacteriales bacterium]|nr:ATP-dependent Clp protease ATP-binding subunit [Eubacteriales bacterium]